MCWKRLFYSWVTRSSSKIFPNAIATTINLDRLTANGVEISAHLKSLDYIFLTKINIFVSLVVLLCYKLVDYCFALLPELVITLSVMAKSCLVPFLFLCSKGDNFSPTSLFFFKKKRSPKINNKALNISLLGVSMICYDSWKLQTNEKEAQRYMRKQLKEISVHWRYPWYVMIVEKKNENKAQRWITVIETIPDWMIRPIRIWTGTSTGSSQLIDQKPKKRLNFWPGLFCEKNPSTPPGYTTGLAL